MYERHRTILPPPLTSEVAQLDLAAVAGWAGMDTSELEPALDETPTALMPPPRTTTFNPLLAG